MKKIAPIAALALLAVAFTSCKKDYKCTCTTTMNGQTVNTTTIDLGKQKKSDAEAACSAKVANVGGASMSCTLD